MPFKNPEGYWRYEGAFSIITTLGVTLHFENGTILQTIGIIVFHNNIADKDHPFSDLQLGYKFIKCIRRDNGRLLWVNRNYQKEFQKEISNS